jgi:hypothetical protein
MGGGGIERLAVKERKYNKNGISLGKRLYVDGRKIPLGGFKNGRWKTEKGICTSVVFLR